MYDPEESYGPYVVLGLVLIHDDADNAAQLNMARGLLRSFTDGTGRLQFRALAQPHNVLVHHVLPLGASADTSLLNGSATIYATNESPVRYINRGWERVMDRGAEKTVVVYDFSGLTESALLNAYGAIRPATKAANWSWGMALTTEAVRVLGWLNETLPAPQATQEFEAQSGAV